MAADGTVREWHEDEGWGVIDSVATPGGCWAHFGAAAVSGYVTFAAGDQVQLVWEAASQDGYAYRAVRFWPAGATPINRATGTSSGGYSSTLSLRFDQPG